MSALAESELKGYDTDFYAWTQEQAARLRALHAAGNLPNELDVENIAEEIESLGRSDLSAVESQLVNVFTHLIKSISAPASLSNSHWRTEGIVFVRAMQRRYSRSMRNRIDLQDTWVTACEAAKVSLEAHGQDLLAGLPALCPFSVADVLESDLRFSDLEKFLGERMSAGR